MKLQEQIMFELSLQRQRLGISVKRLCKTACIPESTYYRWKNGTASPRVSTLERLFETVSEIEKKSN